MAPSNTIGKLFVRLLLEDKQFKKGLDRSKKNLKSTSREMSKFGKGVQRNIGRAFRGATVAVAAFTAATAVVGSKFEQQMQMVAAISGAVGKDFEALESRARTLGSTTAFTATQAAKGMENLARAGLKTKDIIDATGDALFLAGSEGATMHQSTKLLAASMAQFGLEGKDAKRVTDVFGTAMRNSLFNMESLTEAMKFSGTAGAAMGWKIEETTAAVAQFADLGLEGSMAGTQFRMVMASLASPTNKAKEALKDLGLTVDDISPLTHDFKDILVTLGNAGVGVEHSTALFTKRAGLNVLKLTQDFQKSTDKYDVLLEKIKGSAGTTELVYMRMIDTVSGQFDIFKSALQELMLVAFDTYKAPLKGVLTEMAKTIAAMADGFSRGSGEIAQSAEDIMGRMARTLELHREGIVNKFVGTVNSIVNAFKAIIPLLDEIAFLIGTAFVAEGVILAVAAIVKMQLAYQAATVAAVAFAAANNTVVASTGSRFMTAILAATGGLAGLLAGLVAVAAGMVLYRSRAMQATWATADLERVQTRAAKEENKSLMRIAPGLDRLIALRIHDAKIQMAALEISGELTAQRKKELQSIIDFSAQQTNLAAMSGELIKVGEELKSVADIMQEGNAEGLEAVEDTLTRMKKEATAVRIELMDISAVQGQMYQGADAWLGSIIGVPAAGYVREQMAALGVTTRKGMEKLQAMTEKKHRDIQAAIKTIENETATWLEKKHAASVLQDAKDAEDGKTAGVARNKKRAELAAATLEIEKSLNEELNSLTKSQSELLRMENDDRVKNIYESFRERLLLVKEDSEAYKKLIAERQAMVDSSEAIYLNKLTEMHRDAWADIVAIHTEMMENIDGKEKSQTEKLKDQHKLRLAEINKRFDAALALAVEGSKEWLDLVDARNGAVETAQEEHEALMAAMRAKAADDSTKLLQDLTDKLAKLKMDETGQLKFEQNKRIKQLEDLRDAELAIMKGTFEEGQATRARWHGIIEAQEQLHQNELDAIKDPDDKGGGIFKKLFGGGGTSAASGDKKGGFFRRDPDATKPDKDGFIKQSKSGAKKAGGAIGDLLKMATGFAGFGVPGIISSIAGSGGGGAAGGAAVDTVVQTAATFVDTVISALPSILGQIAKAIPVLFKLVVKSLSSIISSLANALPGIIAGITEGLVTLIQALPRLVTKILKSLPSIIRSIVQAIPVVIAALVEAIPEIILSFVEALPDIIQSLVDAIPTLIAALLSGVVKLVTKIPMIIMAIVKGIFKALLNAITSIFKIFKKKDEDDRQADYDRWHPATDAEAEFAPGKEKPENMTELQETRWQLDKAAYEKENPDGDGSLARPDGEPDAVGQGRDAQRGRGGRGGRLASGENYGQSGLDAAAAAAAAAAEAAAYALTPEGIAAAEQAAREEELEEETGYYGPESAAERRARKKEERRQKRNKKWRDKNLGGGRAMSGIQYVPSTMRVTVEPGEAIVPADRNAMGVTGGANGQFNAPLPAMMKQMQGQAFGAAELSVLVDGKLVDSVVVRANDMGRASGVTKMVREASGAHVGVSPGRFNRFTK